MSIYGHMLENSPYGDHEENEPKKKKPTKAQLEKERKAKKEKEINDLINTSPDYGYTDDEKKDLYDQKLTESISEEDFNPDEFRRKLKSNKYYDHSEDPVEYLDEDDLKETFKVYNFFNYFIKKYHEKASIEFSPYGIFITMNSLYQNNQLLKDYERLCNLDLDDDELSDKIDELIEKYISTKIDPAIEYANSNTKYNIDPKNKVTYNRGGGFSNGKRHFNISIAIRF